MRTPEKLSEEKREAAVIAIADLVQKNIRENHRAMHGNKPRIKVTKDEAWIKKHGTNQVDTAALDYFHLPSDWQKERKTGAEIALEEVLNAAKTEMGLDEKFIERTAEVLHARWLERNYNRATETQKESYAVLPESEKEKDRVFARAAVRIFQSTGLGA